MKAIILASGRGTRMKPLTDTTPKPLIKIAGRPIIEHNIEKIYTAVDEIIIVVKYLSEQFEEHFGDNYKGTKISYHTQGDEKGTGAALLGIHTNDDVFILYGDSIIEQRDIDSMLGLDGYGCLVKEVTEPEKYGIFIQKSDGTAERVIEKPTEDYGNLANIGAFKCSSDILVYVEQIELSQRGEYELTDAINLFCEGEKFQLVTMKGDFIDIGTPQDVEKANHMMIKKIYEKPVFGGYNLLEKINGYSIVLGIPENKIDSLIQYSQDINDVELQENTNDINRFSSHEKIEKWYGDDGRYLFSMLDEDMQLAGIYWGRLAKMPNVKEIVHHESYDILLENKENIHTNGIRIYGDYRGKRLAKILFQAEKHYENIFSPCYWSTDISAKNIPSCKGFEKGGYIYMGNGKNINGGNIADNNRRIYVKIVA